METPSKNGSGDGESSAVDFQLPLSPIHGEDHPLNNNNINAAVRTPPASIASSSSYAASLVQSAAKSLLDTPTSLVTDEDDEDSYTTNNSSPYKSSTTTKSSPNLQSLQMETLPAVPDEQDRKRFIGCLAAILAVSYSYDRADNDEEDNNEALINESFAYLEDEIDDKYAADECEIRPSISRCSTMSSFDGEQSFNYGEAQEQEQSTSEECSNNSSKASRHSFRTRKSQREFIKLVKSRHRRRRYEICSNFLTSAAELLILDNCIAKAFMPMLLPILAPPKASSSATSSPVKKSMPMKPPVQSSQPTIARLSDEIDPTAVHQIPEAASWDSSWLGLEGFGGDKTDSPPPSSVGESSSVDSCNPDSSSADIEIQRSWEKLYNDEQLLPFLESLSPGAGFRCLSLLLLQHLLHCRQGYDARIRHALKRVGVIILINEMKQGTMDDLMVYSSPANGSRSNRNQSWSCRASIERATRKFEALEHTVAWNILHYSSKEQPRRQRGDAPASNNVSSTANERPRRRGLTREQVVRGMKIGGAGIVAGTLFAVTGGLAAPGIAAGVAAIAGSAAATTAVVSLTSTAAVTAIFGVGGGGLVAYKMQRRTKTLSEFEFQKETGDTKKVEAELFSTICISGWIRDEYDFQRPWGVTPTSPRLTDRQELLERFYAIHRPEYVTKCAKILAKWRGEEKQLWAYLKKKYGRNPSHLFPLDDGPRQRARLTHEQQETVDKIFSELGFVPQKKKCGENEDRMSPEKKKEGKRNWRQRFASRAQYPEAKSSDSCLPSTPPTSREYLYGCKTPLSDSFHESATNASEPQYSFRTPLSDSLQHRTDEVSSFTSSVASSSMTPGRSSHRQENDQKEESKERNPPKHIATVWDYQSHYGGELYTIRWETKLIEDVSYSVNDMAVDAVKGASGTILRQTALSTLMTAVVVPYALVQAANVIDGDWTLVTERSEEAGQELARSLLFSRAGHRPVTLVGFSMGARTIYCCLKELAKYQVKWVEYQSRKTQNVNSQSANSTKTDRNMDEMLENMREPASIVEDAILMGTPNHLSVRSWIACRQVVAGRLVNVYSRKDLVLSLMFRIKKLTGGVKSVCGTSAIPVLGVENIDVSDIVSFHRDYCLVTGDILKRIRHGQPRP